MNANSASNDPEAMFEEIRRRRILSNICPAEKSLRDPAIELVLTSNILVFHHLIQIPLTCPSNSERQAVSFLIGSRITGTIILYRLMHRMRKMK